MGVKKQGSLEFGDNLLIVVAFLVFIVSVIGAIYSYSTIDKFRNSWMTGFVTQAGQMNISIESSADMNLTYRSINFSSGKVTQNQQNATLCTNGTVARGNWTVQRNGFVLQNTGNVNISIDMMNNFTSTTLLAGTNPYYAFNVTNNKTSSCINGTSYPMASWYAFNATTLVGTGVELCDKLFFEDSRDEIRIDLWLQVPYDSKTGTLGDVFTFTGTANP